MSYNPNAGLVYLPYSAGTYTFNAAAEPDPKAGGGAHGLGRGGQDKKTTPMPIWGPENLGRGGLQARDPKTNTIKWVKPGRGSAIERRHADHGQQPPVPGCGHYAVRLQGGYGRRTAGAAVQPPRWGSPDHLHGRWHAVRRVRDRHRVHGAEGRWHGCNASAPAASSVWSWPRWSGCSAPSSPCSAGPTATHQLERRQNCLDVPSGGDTNGGDFGGLSCTICAPGRRLSSWCSDPPGRCDLDSGFPALLLCGFL